MNISEIPASSFGVLQTPRAIISRLPLVGLVAELEVKISSVRIQVDCSICVICLTKANNVEGYYRIIRVHSSQTLLPCLVWFSHCVQTKRSTYFLYDYSESDKILILNNLKEGRLQSLLLRPLAIDALLVSDQVFFWCSRAEWGWAILDKMESFFLAFIY